MVTGTKTKHNNYVCGWFSWKGLPLLGFLSWTDGLCKIFSIWFTPDIQLEKNWLDVSEKVVAAVNLSLQRNLSLKVRAKMCYIHLPPHPLPSFSYATSIHHPSKSGLGMPKIETRPDTLQLHFLDWICTQYNGNRTAKTSFLSLRSMHLTKGEIHFCFKTSAPFLH